jgi:SAM-dependent methyltransferase
VGTARPPAYGRIARLYAVGLTALGFRRGVERFLDRLDLDFPPGARVVDAGCGTGLLTFWLLDRFPDVRVVAFDIDPAMVKVAAHTAARSYEGAHLELALGDLRTPDRLVRVADGRPLMVDPGTYDGVLIGAALEHVPLLETLEKVRDLLRPGGRLLILGVRQGGMGPVLGHLFRFRPYSLRQLHAAASACGLVEFRTIRLRSREFPANLSRVAILARRP